MQVSHVYNQCTPEANSGMHLDIPLGQVVARLWMKRIVKDDEIVLVTTMVVHIHARVSLQSLHYRLTNAQNYTDSSIYTLNHKNVTFH